MPYEKEVNSATYDVYNMVVEEIFITPHKFKHNVYNTTIAFKKNQPININLMIPHSVNLPNNPPTSIVLRIGMPKT